MTVVSQHPGIVPRAPSFEAPFHFFLSFFLSLSPSRPSVATSLFARLYTRAFFKRREECLDLRATRGPRYLYNRPRGRTRDPASFSSSVETIIERTDDFYAIGAIDDSPRTGILRFFFFFGFFQDENPTGGLLLLLPVARFARVYFAWEAIERLLRVLGNGRRSFHNKFIASYLVNSIFHLRIVKVCIGIFQF